MTEDKTLQTSKENKSKQDEIILIGQLNEYELNFINRFVQFKMGDVGLSENLDFLQNMFHEICITNRPNVLQKILPDNKKKFLENIRKRFNNYKTSLKEDCISVHYYERTLNPEMDYATKMWSRIEPGFLCANATSYGSNCYNYFDNKVIAEKGWQAFTKFELHHTYEQEKIRKSLKCALDNMFTGLKEELTKANDNKYQVLIGINCNLTYFKKYALDVGMKKKSSVKWTKLREDLDKAIRTWIDINRLRDDLYGGKIKFLCGTCHATVTTEPTTQTEIKQRYILKTAAIVD